MAQVTKPELIELVRRKAEKTYTKAEIDDVLTSFAEVLTEELQHGNCVSLKDVGTWEITVHEARSGRNPRTGESIDIPEKAAVRFKTSAVLKRAVVDLDPDKFRDSETKPVRKEKVEDTAPARNQSKRNNRR